MVFAGTIRGGGVELKGGLKKATRWKLWCGVLKQNYMRIQHRIEQGAIPSYNYQWNYNGGLHRNGKGFGWGAGTGAPNTEGQGYDKKDKVVGREDCYYGSCTAEGRGIG